MRLYESYFLADQIPGLFCSELVARFYEKLGLALFAESRPPNRLSLNDLANCMLKCVPEVVVDSQIESEIIQTFCPEDGAANQTRAGT